MTKETAVEWLYQEIINFYGTVSIYKTKQEIIEQAKAMEKEQIESAYNRGTINGIDYPESTLPLTGEQYYNQTYKK